MRIATRYTRFDHCTLFCIPFSYLIATRYSIHVMMCTYRNKIPEHGLLDAHSGTEKHREIAHFMRQFMEKHRENRSQSD